MSKLSYFSSSEFVSKAHPDRLADMLAARVISDIQAKDGFNSHAAIEVMVTRDTIIFSGEATTTLKLTKKYLKSVVTKVVADAGYIPELRRFWTKKQAAIASDYKILNRIVPQSPDIALGTTDKGFESGYNDCGVFFSSADNTTPTGEGMPMYLARHISNALWARSQSSIKNASEVILGPDNKVVVTCKVASDGFTPLYVSAVNVSVAHSGSSDTAKVEELVKKIVYDEVAYRFVLNPEKLFPITVNGTGRFVTMGSVSDTSMTGRKISVNHPSAGPVWANKMIGGGAMTCKPWHASDLILPLACRYIAKSIVRAGLSKFAVVGVSCAIGATEPQSLFIKGDYQFTNSGLAAKYAKIYLKDFEWKPGALVEKFNLLATDLYYNAVSDNFFSDVTFPWEYVDEGSVLKA